MAWFASAKDLRGRRDAGDKLRRAGKIEEAVEEYRAYMRALVESGLKLRAAAACRLVLEMSPGDIEAAQTLEALNGNGKDARDDITLEVQPVDVLASTLTTVTSSPSSAPSRVSMPPIPRDVDDDELLRLVARSSRLFVGLPEDVGAAALSAFEVRVFPAGATLMQALRASPGVYAIDAGTVDVLGSAAPGGVRRCTVGPGSLVGEMSALPDNPATGDVVAKTATTALFLPTQELATIAVRHPLLRAHLDKLSVLRRALDSRWRPDSPTTLA